MSHMVVLPVEPEKLFAGREHVLLHRAQLERIARELTSDRPNDLPQGEDLQQVLGKWCGARTAIQAA